MPIKEKKVVYHKSLTGLLEKYEKAIIVNADNVTSQQLQNIRKALRGTAEIKFGKNTLMKLVINDFKDSDIMKIIPHLKGNVGIIFTDGNLNEIRNVLNAQRVQAPAKADVIAPKSVTVPKQLTTLGPEKTSFFQALQIPTKITRGAIEIINDVDLIKEGETVKASEASLLQMLKIYPFEYGLKISQIYENRSCYSAEALDITQDDIKAAFLKNIQNVSAVAMAMDRPVLCSIPHRIANTIKSLVAVSIGANIDLECTKEIREFLADPSKFAVATAAPVAAVEKKVEEKAEAKVEEEEDSEDSDIGMSLFD